MLPTKARVKRNKLYGPALWGLALLLVLAGCGITATELVASQSLEIVGDIAEPFSLMNMEDAPAIVTIEHRGKSVSAIPLAVLVDKATPHGQSLDILMMAHDGFVARIDNQNLDESYIVLSRQHGWEVVNFNHPPSSNIKNIKQIVVVARDLQPEQQFQIIEPGRSIVSLSVGALYLDGYRTVLTPRGTAVTTSQGQELEVSTYYRHRAIDLGDYANITGPAWVVGQSGEVELLRQDGIFVLGANSLSYMADGEMLIPEAAGVVLNPPAKMITEVYHDAKALLESGEKVLVILVDGFGYHQYEYAKEEGHIPFLSTLPPPEMAMSAFPPITPVNVAASLTGELPHINGVVSRNVRRADVPTIFAWCLQQGLDSAAIIGPVSAVEFEIDPVFSLDLNQDGSTDDEKTENALDIIGEGYDLVFVHYKDVDRVGHYYGDLHPETMEALRGNDAYIEELLSQWQGAVIIYADHGMRSTEDGGDHGALQPEDMFIPYWLFHTNEQEDKQD